MPRGGRFGVSLGMTNENLFFGVRLFPFGLLAPNGKRRTPKNRFLFVIPRETRNLPPRGNRFLVSLGMTNKSGVRLFPGGAK